MSGPRISRRSAVASCLLLPVAARVGAKAPARLRHQSLAVAAPFAMPAIIVPDFSACPRFSITRFGAREGDKARTTAAIRQAIAAAHAAGAGVVVVPPGTWDTGAIHLRSNVNLHLERGACLLFSDDPADYLPPVQTSWEGIECLNYSPLIYAFDCTNVALTGEGKVQARMGTWSVWSARPKPHMDALVALYNMAWRKVPVARRDMTGGEAHLRPHFIQFNRCRNVLVEDITIQDSPFWVLHPLLCRDVVIRRVKIQALGHNNDGVDPEMSQNVLIDRCSFDQGDDAVSVKSGRDHDAWRIGVPARNIVMRDSRIRNGHQLMAIGSELSAGIENVYVHNCHFDHAGSGSKSAINNLLFVKTNERRGGYVRNIHMDGVSATTIAGSVLAVETDVLYQWRDLLPTYDRRLTAIEGLHVSNVVVEEAKSVCAITAEREAPVRHVTLSGVKAGRITGQAAVLQNVEDFRSTPPLDMAQG
jgi:polygalacturonase